MVPVDAFPVPKLRIHRFGLIEFPDPGFRIPCSEFSNSLFRAKKFPVIRFGIPCSARFGFHPNPENSAAHRANPAEIGRRKMPNSLLILENREFPPKMARAMEIRGQIAQLPTVVPAEAGAWLTSPHHTAAAP
jgi:hypothetical protein